MNFLMRFLVGLMAIAVWSGQSDAQVDVKIGGGLLVDNSRWGAHLSADIPIGDTYPTFLSPFVEFYRSTPGPNFHINEIPVGATVLYKAPFSERYGVVFFGVGGGLFIARGTRIPVYDIAGNVIDTISNSVTDPMITAGGGLTLDLSDTIGFFVQGRWFRAFTSGSKNEMSAHLGLSFQLGDE